VNLRQPVAPFNLPSPFIPNLSIPCTPLGSGSSSHKETGHAMLPQLYKASSYPTGNQSGIRWTEKKLEQ